MSDEVCKRTVRVVANGLIFFFILTVMSIALPDALLLVRRVPMQGLSYCSAVGLLLVIIMAFLGLRVLMDLIRLVDLTSDYLLLHIPGRRQTCLHRSSLQRTNNRCRADCSCNLRFAISFAHSRHRLLARPECLLGFCRSLSHPDLRRRKNPLRNLRVRDRTAGRQDLGGKNEGLIRMRIQLTRKSSFAR